MEYAGTGSFWSQLAAPGNHGDPLSSGIAMRRIDELLRSPITSLPEILLDEEAISEFRSSNQKMIGRVTSSEGLKLIVDAILNCDLPDGLSDAHKLQLPFIATEFVACEVEELLEGMVRVVPGQKTPLERLFDYLVDHRSVPARSTILGYVCRVISILVSRKGSSVEKQLEGCGPLLLEALTDLAYDRSVCDLILKLLVDDEMKYFPRSFDLTKLYGKFSTAPTAGSAVCVFETLFGRMMIPSDRLLLIWSRFVGHTNNVVELLVTPPKGYTKYQLDILRVLLVYSFLPHQIVGFSDLPTPEVSSAFWEHSAPVSRVPVVVHPASDIGDDDVVMGDDEDFPKPSEIPPIPLPSKSLSEKFKSNIFTDFGFKLADAIVAKLDEICDQILPQEGTLNLPLIYSAGLLMMKLVKLGVVLDGQISVGFCTNSMFKFPSSSALHNVVAEILVSSPRESVFSIFVPAATNFLEKATAKDGGCYGHICRIFNNFGGHDDDLIEACGAQWRVTNTRLDESHSAVPSPKTAGMPQIDHDEWRPRMYQANRSLDDDDTGL